MSAGKVIWRMNKNSLCSTAVMSIIYKLRSSLIRLPWCTHKKEFASCMFSSYQKTGFCYMHLLVQYSHKNSGTRHFMFEECDHEMLLACTMPQMFDWPLLIRSQIANNPFSVCLKKFFFSWAKLQVLVMFWNVYVYVQAMANWN